MRITVTLDHDNAVRLERLRKQRGTRMKEVVNDVIRRGLDILESSEMGRTREKDDSRG